MPWAEVAALSSDGYAFPEGKPIVQTSSGPTELRLRVGARARVAVGDGLEIEPEVAVEDVEHAAYRTARLLNVVARAVLVWRPWAGVATSPAHPAEPQAHRDLDVAKREQ